MSDSNRTSSSVAKAQSDSIGRRLVIFSTSIPQWIAVAAIAYGLVALFGLAYAALTRWSDASTSMRLAVAGALVAPLLVGALYPRLGGVKAFGFGVTLRESTASLDYSLAPVAMSEDLGSAGPELVEQLAAIARSGAEVHEIDLRDGDYWWPTRLFLVAAIAEEFTEIHDFVFCEGQRPRRFVGFVEPGVLRHALGATDPDLDDRFRGYVTQARAGSPDRSVDLEGLIFRWTGESFERDGAVLDERQYNGDRRVSTNLLRSALNATHRGLRNDALEWPGYLDAKRARAIITEFEHQYIALVRSDGTFERAVDRHELATTILTKVMR